MRTLFTLSAGNEAVSILLRTGAIGEVMSASTPHAYGFWGLDQDNDTIAGSSAVAMSVR